MTKNILILAAGDISNKIHYIKNNYHSPALIPVNSKPLVFHLINFYYNSGVESIHLIIDKRYEQIVKKEIGPYLNKINLVSLRETKGVNDTLKETLKNIELKESEEYIINLVTTIPKKVPAINEVFISKALSKNISWSSITENNSEIEFLSKNNPVKKNGYAFTGVFNTYGKILKNAVKECKSDNDLLEIIQLINKTNKLDFQKVEWIDCGHETNYYQAKSQLLNSRSFNSITINDGILCKTSDNVLKITNEVKFIEMIPRELSTFFPRIISSATTKDLKSFYEMEYYGYPNLAEILLYWNITEEVWTKIFEQVEFSLNKFSKYQYSIGPKAFIDFYLTKSVNRFKDFENQLKKNKENIEWLYSDLVIDNTPCRSFTTLLPDIEKYLKNLYSENDFCIMHGDFCFNNILYDIPSGLIKLIDPRGSFGDGCIGIYGDKKYDIAKFAHSVIGHYDYIVNDHFTLTENSNSFNIRYNLRDNKEILKNLYKELLIKLNVNEKDILFIMGLIFISLVPLHDESLLRQKTFYLNGLKALNSVLAD